VDAPRVPARAAGLDGRRLREAPSEDFAHTTIEFETADGHVAVGEASTSWSYVGAGLRLSAELLGPEYSMSWNSLDAGLKLFFSRAVRGRRGRTWWRSRTPRRG
jgi:predicted dehydrogenase